MKKKLLVFASLLFTSLMFSQIPVVVDFDLLDSNLGYDKALRFNMNNGLNTKAVQLISKSDEGLHFQSKVHGSWSTSMILKQGKLGIGTTTPWEMLDVNGSAKVKTLVIAPTANGNFLQMGPATGLGQRVFNFNSTGDYAGFSALGSTGIARLDFSSNSTSYSLGMKDDTGNEIFKAARNETYGSFIHLPRPDSRIVIGDFGSYLYDKGYKLVVKDGDAIVQGTLVAEEVVVSLTVPPDYVFEKYYKGESTLKADYTMPTLEEVAAFTKANHHLPEVPSAKEIQKNGMQVSEMTSLLLQKVEELTLYTIEQQQQITELKKQVSALSQSSH